MEKRKRLSSEFIAQLSKEERETMIRCLIYLIDFELENPEDDIRDRLIYEYSEMMDALLPDDERLSEEEIEKRLMEIKKRVQANAKS